MNAYVFLSDYNLYIAFSDHLVKVLSADDIATLICPFRINFIF